MEVPLYSHYILYVCDFIFNLVKYLDKDWVNIIMTGYFSLVGTAGMFEFISSMFTSVFGDIKGVFHLQFSMKNSSILLSLTF
jgi:hypothetical protein